VENLVAIELAYVNTRHPDFDEARLIYRGLTDDGVDSSDLRKVSAHNAMTHGGTSSKQVCEFLFYISQLSKLSQLNVIFKIKRYVSLLEGYVSVDKIVFLEH